MNFLLKVLANHKKKIVFLLLVYVLYRFLKRYSIDILMHLLSKKIAIKHDHHQLILQPRSSLQLRSQSLHQIIDSLLPVCQIENQIRQGNKQRLYDYLNVLKIRAVSQLISFSAIELAKQVIEVIRQKYEFKFQYLGFKKLYNQCFAKIQSQLALQYCAQSVQFIAGNLLRTQLDNAEKNLQFLSKTFHSWLDKIFGITYIPSGKAHMKPLFDHAHILFQKLDLDPQFFLKGVTTRVSALSQRIYNFLFCPKMQQPPSPKFLILKPLTDLKCLNFKGDYYKVISQKKIEGLFQNKVAQDLMELIIIFIKDVLESSEFHSIVYYRSFELQKLMMNRFQLLLKKQRKEGMNLLRYLRFFSKIFEEEVVQKNREQLIKYYEKELKKAISVTIQKEKALPENLRPNLRILEEYKQFREGTLAKDRWLNIIYYQRQCMVQQGQGMNEMLQLISKSGLMHQQ